MSLFDLLFLGLSLAAAISLLAAAWPIAWTCA
jgi:hypothetical protein